MSGEKYTQGDWQGRLEHAFQGREHFIGHPMKPIPLTENPARTEKVSTYVELHLLRFYEQYAARAGFRSVSEALRRLSIIGAMAEGYSFDEDGIHEPQQQQQ